MAETLFLGVYVVLIAGCWEFRFAVVVGFGLPDLRWPLFLYGCDPASGMAPSVGVGSGGLF